MKKYQRLFFRNGNSNFNPPKGFITTRGFFYVLKMLLTKDFRICESTNYDQFKQMPAWIYDAKTSISCKVINNYSLNIKSDFLIHWCRSMNIFFVYRMLCVSFSRAQMRKTLNIHLPRYYPHQI